MKTDWNQRGMTATLVNRGDKFALHFYDGREESNELFHSLEAALVHLLAKTAKFTMEMMGDEDTHE